MKTAVVYYSLEGDTERVAKLIAERTGADLIRVQPVKDIPTQGAGKFIKGGYQAVFGIKPALSAPLPDLNIYDAVAVGTPVWAGHCSPAIRAALADASVCGKDVYLFACCAGGSTDKCLGELRKLLAGNSIRSAVSFISPNKTDAAELGQKVDELCAKINDISAQA